MEDAFLSIVHTTVTTNKTGEQETKEKTIYSFAVLKKPHREQLLANIEHVWDEAAAKQEQIQQQAADINPSDLRIDTRGA
jgi:ribosomal protein L23